MLYARLIGRIALFTFENIAHIEFYLQGLLLKILAMYTINKFTYCPTGATAKMSLFPSRPNITQAHSHLI